MNKQIERKQNLRKIIECLRIFGPVPQARLKEQCGLQASTVSYLISDLRQKNLIAEIGKETTQGRVGKPGNVIGLNNNGAVFLGIYVEDDCLHAYRVGIDGQTLGGDWVQYSPAEVEKTIYKTIERELAEHDHIRGIGIAIKAIVYSDGRIKSGIRRAGSSQGTWNMVDLPENLRKAFPQVPIVIENDANSAAELYRYQQQCNDFVLYMLNDIPFGIGCGLMIDGKLHRGHQGAAGEFFVKDLNVEKVHASSDHKVGALNAILSTILPHMLQTAYLLDNSRFILTGSLFRHVSQQEMDAAETYFAQVPVPVFVDYGEAQTLNPAKGAALMAINQYIDAILEEVEKR